MKIKTLFQLVLLLSFFACKDEKTITPQSLSVNPSTINVTLGASPMQLEGFLDGKPTTKLTFKSSNEPAVRVNNNGIVSFISAGQSIITVSTTDLSNKLTTEVIVNVSATNNQTNFAVTPTQYEVYENATPKQLTVTSSNPNLLFEYETDNANVATVSTTGLVTFVGQGTCTIIVRANNEGSTSAITVPVTVLPTPNPNAIYSIVVSTNDDIVFETETTQYTAKAYNYYGTELQTTFNWSISSTAIATINSSGGITGFRAGTAQVIATAQNVSSSPKPLYVASRCGADTMNFPSLGTFDLVCMTNQITLSVGESKTIFCEIQTKGGGTFGSGIQCLNDPNIAELVPNSSMIRGLAPGNTLLTAVWNGRYEYVYVTVTP